MSIHRFAPVLALPALFIAAAVAPVVADPPIPSPELPSATRGPRRIVFSRDGRRGVVSEGDSGTLAVVDTASGTILGRFPTGGEQPNGIALTGSGMAIVANSFSGSVAEVGLTSGKRAAFLTLRGEPTDVVLSRDGRRVFVSLAQLDQVAVLDLPGLRLAKRVPVGRRPAAMALTADGGRLLVANMQGGTVTVIDTGALKGTRQIPLGGVNLRSLAVSADGERAFVTGQVPARDRVTRDPLLTWKNTLFAVDLTASESGEGKTDVRLDAAPDPDGVAMIDAQHAAVAAAGVDQALRVRTSGRANGGMVEQRAGVGARPRGIAVTPDHRQVWVANELGSTISVLDAASFQPLRQIDLGQPARPDGLLGGRYLFGSARFTRGREFTCASCHPDGGVDGMTWRFVHVQDGLEQRNTRDLRGGITGTGPFRWSGHTADLEEFFQEEITGLMGGSTRPHHPLHQLWMFVDQLSTPPNPYRQPNGQLTGAGARGKVLFNGKARCASCHGGEMFGGTGKKAWVGTTPSGLALDVPHLAGVYDTSPYLHDGSAKTLEEVFTHRDAARKHGDAHLLTKPELADLLSYVRQL